MSDITPSAGAAALAAARAITEGAPAGGAPKLPDPDREYVSIKYAQEKGGVTRRTVMGWFERGLIQRFKGPNGYTVLIDKLELESFLLARRTRIVDGEDQVAPRVIDGEPVWD